jgi:ATP-dependent DNA helicase RecQ
MLKTPLDILQFYWGYASFRPQQEEIIQSVLSGQDTLALLPTGGGKSICFQVPALMLEGVCIVVTPLIALMNDQVNQLKQRNIDAIAIHAGMGYAEIDRLLDNCVYGTVKFLYVSPERLHSELFVERVKKMTVGLIAVDEAHCISQWGYDFRPSYLEIRSLRKLKPQVPIIALTATATVDVQHDICEKLDFSTNTKIFKQSFARPNLSFVVRKGERKEKMLLDILSKVQGSAIIYVRSRRATQEVADFLTKRSISASYYHAGLSFENRMLRQEEWIKNRKRVMVATNAFGMGIDKHDVRLVIHLDLPENLESYYQEAGRAGRDGKKSYAVILYHEADAHQLETKTEQAHPPLEVLKKIYQGLANYYQLAIGAGEGVNYDFDIIDFADRFSFSPTEVYASLKKLEEEDLIYFSESYYSPSHLCLGVDKLKLYEFQIAHAKFDAVIKMLLRLYGGELFSNFVNIDESYLAKALKIREQEMVSVLQHLHQLGIVIYQPMKNKPQLGFVMGRQDADRLPIQYQRLVERKNLVMSKIRSMIHYAEDTDQCRMLKIQHYFQEQTEDVCGICDVCIQKKKSERTIDVKTIRDEILTVLKQSSMTIDRLEEMIMPSDTTQFTEVVRILLDEGAIVYDDAWKLHIK